MTRFLYIAALCFASLLFLSCTYFERDNPCDENGVNYNPNLLNCTGLYCSLCYEGQTYKTAVIGTQTWMAENLNYNASGSKCYNNKSANCNKYGRLYNWSTAMGLPSSCNSNSCSGKIKSNHQGICPSGWHIPDDSDWDKLYRYADSTSGTLSPYSSPTAGRYLKATSGWNSDGNGTDQYGFSALPGGFGYSDGSFKRVGDYGVWWSASEGNNDLTYYRYTSYNDENADWDYDDKSILLSVRCLQN